MMKRSQNLFAETIFRALGSKTGDGTAEASQNAIGALLSAWSIDSDQFIIADGSGLSRYNYLTPAALVAVLEQVRSDRQSAAVFEATLPVGRTRRYVGRSDGRNCGSGKRACEDGDDVQRQCPRRLRRHSRRRDARLCRSGQQLPIRLR